MTRLGIGLIMKELGEAGVLDDTVIIFSSDNGIPFPSGRTNLYDSGIKEPFLISHPTERTTWGQVRTLHHSLLEFLNGLGLCVPRARVVLSCALESQTYKSAKTFGIFCFQAICNQFSKGINQDCMRQT